jgi:hypothetical protein
MRPSQKLDLLQKWVHLFIEQEVVTDVNGRIPSMQLYEAVRQWMFKYVNHHFTENLATPTYISPCISMVGYPSLKIQSGRRLTVGCRYRYPSRHAFSEVAARGKSGKAPVPSEEETARIPIVPVVIRGTQPLLTAGTGIAAGGAGTMS